MRRVSLILLALVALDCHSIDCHLFARLARDPLKSRETLQEMRKAIEEVLAASNYGADPHAGKLMPLLESMPDRVAEKLRAIGSMGKPLNIQTLKDVVPGEKYTYVVLPIDGKPVIFISSGLSHRQVGGWRQALSAGEMFFKAETTSNGDTRIVVDHFNLQSGLYQPHPERALATFDALVEAGFGAPQLSHVKVANGTWDKAAGENTIMVNFRSVLEGVEPKAPPPSQPASASSPADQTQ